ETWKRLTSSVLANEDLTVRVTKLASGKVSGPIQETWTVAQAPLKGTLYYNSYDSKLANGIGALLKLKPGGNAELLAGGNGKCTVCHSVAANGSVLIASNDDYKTGAKYDLLHDGASSGARKDYAFNFPAVYPDGSVALTTSGRHIGGMWSDAASVLYNVS